MTRFNRIGWLYIVLSALALPALLIPLSGCGGGSAASPPPVDDTLFTPNYVTDLGGLYHWDHLPVKIAFDLPENWTTLYPSNSDLHVDAADEWNQPGKQAMTKVVTTGADVEVTFVEQSELGGNTQGMTYYTYNSYGYMIDASIEIALDCRGRMLPASDVQMVIAHEIGHALGIGGHSSDPNDLMYATLTFGQAHGPTERDLNTAMTAYASYFAEAVPAPSPSRGPVEVYHDVIE